VLTAPAGIGACGAESNGTLATFRLGFVPLGLPPRAALDRRHPAPIRQTVPSHQHDDRELREHERRRMQPGRWKGRTTSVAKGASLFMDVPVHGYGPARRRGLRARPCGDEERVRGRGKKMESGWPIWWPIPMAQTSRIGRAEAPDREPVVTKKFHSTRRSAVRRGCSAKVWLLGVESSFSRSRAVLLAFSERSRTHVARRLR
jgi:hypothetical protein